MPWDTSGKEEPSAAGRRGPCWPPDAGVVRPLHGMTTADPEANLTERCMDNRAGRHADCQEGFPALGDA